jgi:hypothetical protein
LISGSRETANVNRHIVEVPWTADLEADPIFSFIAAWIVGDGSRGERDHSADPEPP